MSIEAKRRTRENPSANLFNYLIDHYKDYHQKMRKMLAMRRIKQMKGEKPSAFRSLFIVKHCIK